MNAWDELERPWRVSFALAWEAYLAGTIPVGSVVAAPDGTIVARGRNRIFDAPRSGLAGSRLAHAEVDALSQLPVTERYRDHVLYSTLEPCLLCTAATLLATVGRIEYATEDPFGGACTGSIETAHWQRSAPEIAPPLGSWPGKLSAALQSAFWQAHLEHARAAEITEQFGDDARSAGERVRALDGGVSAQFEEALPRLLECL
ncbi:MAG TPA: nucleoside deaminase [Gaiellaceae bacterium]|nr:nucleoside deaminase [Gaiellaceae bacterium]